MPCEREQVIVARAIIDLPLAACQSPQWHSTCMLSPSTLSERSQLTAPLCNLGADAVRGWFRSGAPFQEGAPSQSSTGCACGLFSSRRRPRSRTRPAMRHPRRFLSYRHQIMFIITPKFGKLCTFNKHTLDQSDSPYHALGWCGIAGGTPSMPCSLVTPCSPSIETWRTA